MPGPALLVGEELLDHVHSAPDSLPEDMLGTGLPLPQF